MNVLKPGAIKKINTMSAPFKQMENIEHFLRAATEYGLNPSELFQTVDLYKQQNMVQVLITIMALGRKSQANGFKGPSLGPKEATKHQRDFTEEQMKQGDTIIGLQMGSNKGANQSGINFGKTRSILD
uniref:Transgelin n=1 Tax=Myxobolus squamalis TaxID=59785 RepID=A0A6B2G2D8_MYXSQ